MVCLKRLECNLAQAWSEPNGICEWSAAHEKSPVTEGGASYTRRLGEKRRTRRALNQMRIGSREFRKELTLSFAVNSLPVDHAPFDPANFSLTAPSGALLFWQERDGQESARLLALILA